MMPRSPRGCARGAEMRPEAPAGQGRLWVVVRPWDAEKLREGKQRGKREIGAKREKAGQ